MPVQPVEQPSSPRVGNPEELRTSPSGEGTSEPTIDPNASQRKTNEAYGTARLNLPSSSGLFGTTEQPNARVIRSLYGDEAANRYVNAARAGAAPTTKPTRPADPAALAEPNV